MWLATTFSFFALHTILRYCSAISAQFSAAAAKAESGRQAEQPNPNQPNLLADHHGHPVV